MYQRLEDKKEKIKVITMKKLKKYVPLYTPFVEQRKHIDHFSMLYSFEASFKVLHAAIADIKFLSKSAVKRNYRLIACFSLILYLKNMHAFDEKQRYIEKKIALFCEDIREKRKTGKEMRIQIDR